MATPTDPYAPVPIIAPIEVRRVVQRIVGWHVICRACGITFSAPTRMRQTCGHRCRNRLVRLRKLQRQRENEEREKARVERAERVLRHRYRRGIAR
jgi:Ni/Co efflux regulator RcnB